MQENIKLETDRKKERMQYKGKENLVMSNEKKRRKQTSISKEEIKNEKKTQQANKYWEEDG